MPPIPELDGQRLMSLNWIDAKNAEMYQVGLMKDDKMSVIDEEKEEV